MPRLASRSNSPGAVLIVSIALILLVVAPFSSQARDLGVCAAYQQLLNQTHFDRTPFCGRPDFGPVSGFTQLKHRYWGVEQIWPIFAHVYEFMLFDNQFHVQRFYVPYFDPKKHEIDPKKSYWSQNPATKGGISQSLRLHWMRVWSYEEPIDIENNGLPLDVLVWQGYGATGLSGGGGPCGSDYEGHQWTFSYVNQQAFVINADGKTINEQLTREIFGASEESTPARLSRRPLKNPMSGANPFRPLADSIGVFEYRGRYYIETENRPKTEHGALPPVVVYLREHGHTTKLCSLQLKDKPRPEND